MASPLVATVRCLLPIINRVHTIVLGIRPVGRSSVISVAVRRHKGSLIRLHDGCEVKPGAPVIKLHFNNAWIAEGLLRSGSGSGTGGFPRGLIYYFKDSLQLLATDVGNGKYDGIVARIWLDRLSCSCRTFGISGHRFAEHSEDKAGRTPHPCANAVPENPLVQNAHDIG